MRLDGPVIFRGVFDHVSRTVTNRFLRIETSPGIAHRTCLPDVICTSHTNIRAAPGTPLRSFYATGEPDDGRE